MCMLLVNGQVLIQERLKQDWPGLTFPGGKVEANESNQEAMIREFKEETGLTLLDATIQGIVSYDVKDKGEKLIIILYKASQYKGELIGSSEEGKVYFMPFNEVVNSQFLSNDLRTYITLIQQEGCLEMHAYFDGHTSSQIKIK